MRKSHAETLALNAMRAAQAAGQSEADIVFRGKASLYCYDRSFESMSDASPLARALYDKYFTVKDAN